MRNEIKIEQNVKQVKKLMKFGNYKMNCDVLQRT